MRTLFRWFGMAIAASVLVAALAPFVDTESERLWMLLTYPPRLLLAVAATVLTVTFVSVRLWPQAAVGALAAIVATSQIGWGGGGKATSADALVLLAFNVKDATSHATSLRKIVQREGVDVLVLQEVKARNRQAFIDALPEFKFVWGDEKARFEHDDWGPFSSMTGFRRELGWEVVDKVTGLTGYRTFAVSVSTQQGPAWFVNVHTTKAFWLQGSPRESLTRADYKSAWHVKERRLLGEWLLTRGDAPVVLAGDFNAPHNVPNAQFPRMGHAHLAVGSGPHLTFPKKLPIWGIDHVLASDGVTLQRYSILSANFSDHRAQLLHFRL